MLLDRLESGFLLFETPQGLVRAELSLRQRIRLLWTFRHFRQLSTLLLNERERVLVNALYQHNAGVALPADPGSPVIGVIENFVPPPRQIETAPEAHSDLPSESLPIREPIQQERVEQTPLATDADVQVGAMARFSTGRGDLSSSAAKGAIDSMEPAISLKRYPDTNQFFPAAASALQKFVRRSLATFKLTTPTFSTIAAVLAIVMIAVLALHRVLATPALQAHNPASVQPYKMKMVESDSALAAAPATTATSLAALSTPAVPVQSAEESSVPSAKGDPFIPVRSRRVRGNISHRELRAQRVTSTPHLSIASQEGGIQATRPPLHFVYPAYVNVRGKVALTARVEADGTVSSVRVVAGNRVLTEAAVRAVRHWRYRPYLKDGQAVVTETNIVVSFFAEDAISMTFPTSLPSAE